MALPIPPWLGPQTQFGELFTRGAAIGADLRSQRQRLAAAQQDSQMQAQLQQNKIQAEQEMLDRKLAAESQRAAIDAEKDSVVMGMRQKELQQQEQQLQLAQAKGAMDWKMAADEYSRMQAVDAEVKRLTATGVPAEEAARMAILRHAPQSAPASMFNESQIPNLVGQNITTPEGQSFAVAVDTANRRVHFPSVMNTGEAGLVGTAAGRDILNIGGKPTMVPTIPFKFSKQGQLDRLLQDPSIAAYMQNPDLKPRSRSNQPQIDAMRKTYNELIKERESELAEYNRQRQPTIPRKTLREYDPSADIFNW